MFGQLDDILLTGRTFLPVDEPFTQAVNVKNVITNRDLHELFVLLEVTQTKFALGLLDHVKLVPWIVELISFWVLIGFESYTIHNLEVDRHDSFDSLNVFTVVFKLTIGLFSVKRVAVNMMASFFTVH